MPQTQLFLIPTPGAKPEFLATVSESNQEEKPLLPSKIVLEGYTRDAWAWKPHPAWTTVTVACVDEKSQQKVAGFTKYLKDRQKCAYGRLSETAIISISYIQSSAPKLTCRIARDATQIPNCSIIKPKKNTVPPPPQKSTAPPTRPPPAKTQPSNKKSGMLGNLLGAQKRTDQHMSVTVQPKKKPQDTTNGQSKTAQEVLQDFRQAMEQKMLDFDLEGDNCLKIKVSVAEWTQGLDREEKMRVTMEVLKYIVYEQAEEVNDEWVAVKEPSEFMDDVVIAVYKEAPPEVLEEVNKAELPDEVRGQQRAIQEARQRVVDKQEAKLQAERMTLAMQTADEEEDMATLNTNKRDRRTIEEIQREMNDPKRAKTGES